MCSSRLQTFSSIFGVNSEDGRLVDGAVDETRAIGADVTAVHVVNVEL